MLAAGNVIVEQSLDLALVWEGRERKTATAIIFICEQF
jgi:hypothetical protein